MGTSYTGSVCQGDRSHNRVATVSEQIRRLGCTVKQLFSEVRQYVSYCDFPLFEKFNQPIRLCPDSLSLLSLLADHVKSPK